MHARFTGKSLKSGHTVIENLTATKIIEIAKVMNWKVSRIWIKRI